MLNTKIDSNKIDCISDNKLTFNLPENLKNMKIVDATLNIKVNTVKNAEEGYYVNFSSYDENDKEKSKWNNVDFVKGFKAGQSLKINISDELQDAISKNAKKVELKFSPKTKIEGSSENSISFEKDEDNDFIKIDYISLFEYQDGGASHTVDLKDAGTLNVSLLTGELSLSTKVTSSNQAVLPLSIVNNYSNKQKSSVCGKNNLNLNQFLIENESEDGSLSFSYIDANGKSQIINESYYYVEGEEKVYVKKENLKVDLDGTLKTKAEGKEVKTELNAPSGLKLVSSIEGLEGSDLVDYKPEELASVENAIKQLRETIDRAKLSIESSRMQLCDVIIGLQRTRESTDETQVTTTGLKNELKSYLQQDSANPNQERETDSSGKNIEEVLPDEFINSFFANFSNENDKTTIAISTYDKTSGKLQVKPLYSSIKSQLEKLQEYKDQLKKYEYQESLFQMQVPVHYLYDENNIIYGFGKTEDKNIFRLVLIMDSYENAISISHESLASNKIKAITDSADKNIVFNHEEDGTVSVIDSRDRVTKLESDSNGNIVKIMHSGGAVCRYYYEGGKLVAVVNSSGFGAKISYADDRVSKVEAFSVLKKIENEKAEFKAEIESISDFTPYLIDSDFVEIEYNNFRSTTVKNGKGKSLTYLFDKFGKVTTTYENQLSLESKKYSVRATNYEYQNNKISLKTSILPYSQNYLSDVCFEEKSITQTPALYFSENTYCSELTFPFTYLSCEKFHTLLEADENIDHISVSNNYLEKINSGEGCPHRTFVVSGWAKADSAYVADDEDYEADFELSGASLNSLASNADEMQTEGYQKYLSGRRFGLRARVEYQDGRVRDFYRSFDWRNTEWQYCSLPIKLEEGNVKSINCSIEYVNNTGKIEYTDLELKEGDYELVKYNESNSPVRIESGHSNWITYNTYDKDNKLIETTLANKKDNSQKFKTTYEYNKNGKLLKTISYNGIVKENVYNDRGILVKTITYNKNEPTLKFYNEQTLDEKGNVLSDTNELGEEVTKYKYIEGTGIACETTDVSGSKTAYGYDDSDTLLQVSTSVSGITNTNIFGYTLGFLTGLESNGQKIDYNYDEQGRVTKIKIAGETYLTKTYNKFEEITTLATGEMFKHTFNDDGNVLSTCYRESETQDWKEVSSNFYDVYGNLYYTKDNLDNENIHLMVLDKFNNITQQTETQHTKKIEFSNAYDKEHQNIEESSVKIGEDSLTYNYGYDNDLDKKLNSVEVSKGLQQSIKYDRLNRVKCVSVNNVSKEYEYLTQGDHATNLVSKETYSVDNITSENLKYSYDEMGNITEVRQNNNLVARYSYDSLSRLVREDNRLLGKTTTFAYDANGNILNRTEYNFTLIENLDYETGINFDYSYSAIGWKDQLKCYNGESFVYDQIGNPSIYRGKQLEWSYGRLLNKFADIEFKYNANGVRTSKTVNGKNTKFYLNGTQILRQEDDSNVLDFFYGADGIIGFALNNKNYTYKKNIQGDIIGIYDETNVEICKYVYDAWGNHKCYILSNSGEYIDISIEREYNINELVNRLIAKINPFRYRGYYYDTENNLYYLNSRYYDPELGRFINADDTSYLNPSSLNGLNLYAYCNNNPIMYVDNNGNFGLFAMLFIGFLVGSVVGGVVTYEVAKENGYTGKELAAITTLGAFGGGLFGAGIGLGIGYLAPVIPTIGGIGSGLGFSAAGGGAAILGGTIAIDGTIAVLGVSSLVGTQIMLTRIGNSGGYRFDHHYPNDHKPTHVHISGDDGKTKVDLTGKPLPGQRPMTYGESKAFRKMIKEIIKALSKWM